MNPKTLHHPRHYYLLEVTFLLASLVSCGYQNKIWSDNSVTYHKHFQLVYIFIFKAGN